MSPLTSKLVTRLDPSRPMLWRDVDTVQFGLDDGMRLTVTEPWTERLLQALRNGFRPHTFDVIAHGVGAPREAARELLARLQPILRTDPPPPPRVWIESVNIADSRVGARLQIALQEEGILTVDRADADAVGIALVHGAVAARQMACYLRADIAHLPVAFEPGHTAIGPLVRPGTTPCLSCRDASGRDMDPAWPMMHAQLVGATRSPITLARVAEAAHLVRAVLDQPETEKGSRHVRINPDGHRDWRSVTFHEECRCREQSFRSPPGSATVDALHAPPLETTTPPAFARPA